MKPIACIIISSVTLACWTAGEVGARAQGRDAHDQSQVPVEVDTADPKLTKIVLLAGPPSHGPGEHEFFAGCALLMKMLQQTPGVFPVLCRNGWPKNEGVLQGAKSVVCFSDGGGGHPLLQGNRLETIGKLMKQGAGLALIHYAVEPTKEKGQKEFLEWVGGCFEVNWSVNPHWVAEFTTYPEHPITRGIKPFKINDEWYFHMRFVDGLKGVTPLLAAVAPASTMSRGDGPHSGNPAARKAVADGKRQELAWAYERPDGVGRGFGFTGAHFHANWGEQNFRRLVVNAILWTAHVEIPSGGARCDLDAADLNKNLDKKGR